MRLPDVSRPAISVLTPSFAYGRFIRDAIESVSRQQPPTSIEHVVQDGASEDGTLDVLRSYGDRIDWRSEIDSGQSQALNRAFARATGQWIAWLNADEFYLPGMLSHLLSAGEESNSDVVYGDAVFVDGNGCLLRLLPQHRFSSYVLRSYGPFVSSCSVLFRQEVLGEAPWDEDLKGIMDYDLYLRLQSEGRTFLHVPIPVGVFRVHEARVTAQPREHFLTEHRTLEIRYGFRRFIEQRPSPGRVVHGARKLFDGAYGRQRAASKLGPLDLRWFRGPKQERAVGNLIQASYPDLSR